MKQTKHLGLIVLLLMCSTYLSAQNSEQTSTRAGTAVGVARPKPNFDVEQGTLKQLTNNLNVALRSKNAADLAKCFVSNDDATWWVAQFDSKGTGITPEQAAQRILEGARTTERRLQSLQNSYDGFVVVSSEAKWADPEQLSKAVLLSGNLLSNNQGQESVRFFLVVIDGKYKILSMK